MKKLILGLCLIAGPLQAIKLFETVERVRTDAQWCISFLSQSPFVQLGCNLSQFIAVPFLAGYAAKQAAGNGAKGICAALTLATPLCLMGFQSNMTHENCKAIQLRNALTENAQFCALNNTNETESETTKLCQKYDITRDSSNELKVKTIITELWRKSSVEITQRFLSRVALPSLIAASTVQTFTSNSRAALGVGLLSYSITSFFNRQVGMQNYRSFQEGKNAQNEAHQRNSANATYLEKLFRQECGLKESQPNHAINTVIF